MTVRDPRLQWALALALGGVFLYASADKILHPAEFARIVYHFHVIGPSQRIPPLVPNLFSIALPWVEAIAGLALVGGIWRREAAALVAVMLTAFLIAIGSAMARGIDIEKCGCFSVTGEGTRAGAEKLAEDAGLLAIAVLLATSAREPRTSA